MTSKNFTVFSKDGCPYCTKIQEVLDLAGLSYVTYKLGKDFDRKSFYGEFGEGSPVGLAGAEGVVLLLPPVLCQPHARSSSRSYVC